VTNNEVQISELRRQSVAGNVKQMAEPLIERSEIVALLFNVSDINNTLLRIEKLLEDDGETEEADEG
jgi:hypothetical protein